MSKFHCKRENVCQVDYPIALIYIQWVVMNVQSLDKHCFIRGAQLCMCTLVSWCIHGRRKLPQADAIEPQFLLVAFVCISDVSGSQSSDRSHLI